VTRWALPARLAFAASALALAAGCAVGPTYRPPAAPSAAGRPFVSAAPTVAQAGAPPAEWWRLYDDPALDELVREALTENEALKTAAANLARAAGVLAQARAGLFPSTSATFADQWGVSSTGQLVTSITGQAQPPSWYAVGGFNVSYELDLFGRIRRSIEAARADAAGAAEAENVVRITVAAETARAYADACAYAEQAGTARKSAKTADDVLGLTRQMRDLGARSDFDVASAAAVADEAHAQIPTFEGERRAQLFELAVLTGRPPAEISEAADACNAPPRIERPLPVGDGAALIERRPDIREAEQTLHAATARIGVAAADFFPTVSLTGSASPSGATPAQFVSRATFGYQLGPLITWTFPNVLVARAEVLQARATASGAIASFDSVVLNALKETEQALTTYDAELSRHASLIANRDDNRRAFALAQQQLQNGSIGFPDLLVTERNLDAAEAELAQSDQALVDDQVTVFQSLGGGWENAPPVRPPKSP
jgi:NodT family efflux transporter outer membrane factor (OMF) lipoprotein